jgi:hypothetical protein
MIAAWAAIRGVFGLLPPWAWIIGALLAALWWEGAQSHRYQTALADLRTQVAAERTAALEAKRVEDQRRISASKAIMEQHAQELAAAQARIVEVDRTDYAAVGRLQRLAADLAGSLASSASAPTRGESVEVAGRLDRVLEACAGRHRELGRMLTSGSPRLGPPAGPASAPTTP